MSTNVAQTIWSPNNGTSEYVAGTVQAIVDSSSVALVDSSGVAVVDVGVTLESEPATVWTEDDSR